jgi:hypothetical protein
MSIEKPAAENAAVKTATVEVNPLTAEVKPLTVEIKTLTIDGEKITPVLFQQLPNESPFTCDKEVKEHGDEINSVVSLRGRVWGRVNYYPDGHIPLENIQVIWVDREGDTLKRGIVHAPSVVLSSNPGMFAEVLLGHDPVYTRRTVIEEWIQSLPESKKPLAIQQLNAFAESYFEHWEAISKLDQLFIMV